MPAAAGKVNGAPDDLYKDDLAGKAGFGFKAKPAAVELFGTKFSFSVGAQAAKLPGQDNVFTGAPSVKFAVPVGDFNIAVDKLAFDKAAKGGVILESAITTSLDKAFKASLKAAAKGMCAESLTEAKLEYKLPDVTLDCKLAPGKDKGWAGAGISLGFGLAPVQNLGLGIKLGTSADKVTEANLSAAVDYQTEQFMIGAGFDKLKSDIAMPACNVKAMYKDVPDLSLGCQLDVKPGDAGVTCPLSLGLEYTGVAGLTLGVAAFPMAGDKDTVAALSAKYAIGKSSATLGLSASKDDLKDVPTTLQSKLGLTFEIA